MSWVDQCKIAFKAKADALSWRQEKGDIIKQLSEESDIPPNVLKKWLVENGNQSEPEEYDPICRFCRKNKAAVSQSGKVTMTGLTRQLCSVCRGKSSMARKLDKEANNDNGMITGCPSCGHVYYVLVTKERMLLIYEKLRRKK